MAINYNRIYTHKEAKEILEVSDDIWKTIYDTTSFAGTIRLAYKGLIKAKIYQLLLVIGIDKGQIDSFCDFPREDLMVGKEVYHYPPFFSGMDCCHIKLDLEEIRKNIDRAINAWEMRKKPVGTETKPCEGACKEMIKKFTDSSCFSCSIFREYIQNILDESYKGINGVQKSEGQG